MKKLLIFIVVAIGGGVGYQIGFTLTKKKYEGLADEEVKSVKEKLIKHYEDKKIHEKKTSPTGEKEVEDKTPVKKKVVARRKNEPIDSKVRPTKGEGTDYSKRYRSESDPERIPGDPSETMVKHLKEEEIDTTKPYVITSDVFSESEFQCVQLFYCADKVLTDDDYNQISNIGIVGGHPNLEQMGKYDADCLYVRDEKKGIDYEILLEERTFSKLKPLGIVE